MKNTDKKFQEIINTFETENMVKSLRNEIIIDERIEKFVKSEKNETEKTYERIFGE